MILLQRVGGGQVKLVCGGKSVGWFLVSFSDSVHPIDYSGRAVLVRLGGRHFFPKGGFQS